jgi:hypothetical protein
LTIGSPEQHLSIPSGQTQSTTWGQVTASSSTDTQMPYSLTARDSLGSNSVTRDFVCNVAGECPLTPEGNFIVDYAKCELVCPLQESSCTALGKSLDVASCSCRSASPPQVCPFDCCTGMNDAYIVKSCSSGFECISHACVEPPKAVDSTQYNGTALVIVSVLALGVGFVFGKRLK